MLPPPERVSGSAGAPAGIATTRMARNRYNFDAAKIARFQKAGRGQGAGPAYTPWLTVQDVPSRGRRHRIHGRKVDRVYHLMSDGELVAFLQFDESAASSDIQEQVPLDPFETDRIAREMGIRPPVNPDGSPYVMTTDFLIVEQTPQGTVHLARTCKPNDDHSKRTLEKLEIERRYWKGRGIDWAVIVTAGNYDDFVKNVMIVRAFRSLEGVPEPYAGCHADVAHHLVRRFEPRPDITLSAWCDSIDLEFGVPRGIALMVAKHLLAHKMLETDLWSPAQIEQRPLAKFFVAPQAGGVVR